MTTRTLFPGVLAAILLGGAAARAAEHTPSPLFVQKCTKCHGEDGTGNTPKGRKLKARDFTDPEFQAHKSDKQLVETVKNGTEKDMPAFGKILAEDEIEKLVKEDVRAFGRK
jgi:mono/diheme cytochrome c family protein